MISNGEGTGTTTYHLGNNEPICRQQLNQLSNVIWWTEARTTRRLCKKCARIVRSWVGAAFDEMSATHLQHPGR